MILFKGSPSKISGEKREEWQKYEVVVKYEVLVNDSNECMDACVYFSLLIANTKLTPEVLLRSRTTLTITNDYLKHGLSSPVRLSGRGQQSSFASMSRESTHDNSNYVQYADCDSV